MNVDTDLIRNLAELLEETGLTEIEVAEGERKVRVARGQAPTLYASAAAPIAPASSGAPVEGGAEPDPHANAVRSEIVGTAYLASEPGAPPFVRPGDKVNLGDTILIIEAMKVMNAITAPRAGTLKLVLVESGAPIEYDQPLFVIA